MVQNLESPRLSGRVDSVALLMKNSISYREAWHLTNFFWLLRTTNARLTQTHPTCTVYTGSQLSIISVLLLCKSLAHLMQFI